MTSQIDPTDDASLSHVRVERALVVFCILPLLFFPSRDGVLSQFELEGNAEADKFAKRGASYGASSENDVLFIEGCLAIASQAAKLAARMATRMVNEDIRDHQGLDSIRLIDLGVLDLAPPINPQPGPEAPPEGEEAEAVTEEGLGGEEAEDESFGIGIRVPWRVNGHSVLEAGVPGSEPIIFCTTCYKYAVHQKQRGLCSACSGPRRLKGGSSYTIRKRLRELKHPTDDGVSLDEPQVPSSATRAKWASHFGLAGDEARPPSRLGLFSGRRAPSALSLATVLKAFGFSSRASAEELGKRAVLGL